MREQEPPALETVRPALDARVRQAAVSDYVKTLSEASDIQVMGQEQAEQAPQAEATK